MSDVPFTNDDEREWVDDGRVDDVEETGPGGELDDTGAVDARVLTDASEFDALEQRRALTADDDRDVVLPDDDR